MHGVTVLSNKYPEAVYLYVVQASSSLKYLDTRTFTYSTPILITKVLHLVTQVQLLMMTVAVN